MSAKKVFTLAEPFEFRGTTYNQLEARRPKVRDLRQFIKGIDADSVKAMEVALSNLCEVDEVVIGELDLEDFGPMKTWFEGFLKPMLGESSES